MDFDDINKEFDKLERDFDRSFKRMKRKLDFKL